MSMDEVVKIIRASVDKTAARNNLMGFFGAAAPQMSLVVKDQTKVEFTVGIGGISKIFIHNATMKEMEHLRDVMEMPEPEDYMGHTEGIPDACKPIIRTSDTKSPSKILMYGIPEPSENGGLIRCVKFYAYDSEAEAQATVRLEALFGPVGVEITEKVVDYVLDAATHREEYMKMLEEDYEKKTGKKL